MSRPDNYDTLFAVIRPYAVIVYYRSIYKQNGLVHFENETVLSLAMYNERLNLIKRNILLQIGNEISGNVNDNDCQVKFGNTKRGTEILFHRVIK